MTAVDEEVFTFESTDILPPCEYVEHDRVGDGPAAWALVLAWCNCKNKGNGVRLQCDACFQWWSTAPGVQCQVCGYRVRPPSRIILRAERL